MSNTERICVFFSIGNDFMKVIKTVRSRYPQAHITAMAPVNLPLDGAPADEIVRMEVQRYRPWHLGAIRRLAAQLKEGRYDRFVVLFPSMKLKTMAALSGARHCECWGVDGRIRKLEPSMTGNLIAALKHRTDGISTFLSVWGHTLFRPAKKFRR